jgi:hypothetical protein
VPINFPFAFEVLVAKIFNHLFSPKGLKVEDSAQQNLQEVIDKFFKTPVFGNWGSFTCDNNTSNFPKVTSSSGRNDGHGYTIATDSAKNGVRRRFKKLPPHGLWLLPRPQSSSPDLMHISMSNGEKRILCVAVKNYSPGSHLGTTDIDTEIGKAVRMIPDSTYRAVLVVACTSYSKEISSCFGGCGFFVYPTEGESDLLEVILLNLTSPELRARICGVDKSEGIRGLEILIRKTHGHLGFNDVPVDTDPSLMSDSTDSEL